ncbi:hypothetical protein Tco_1501257 [Tanacetum coccineum]
MYSDLLLHEFLCTRVQKGLINSSSLERDVDVGVLDRIVVFSQLDRMCVGLNEAMEETLCNRHLLSRVVARNELFVTEHHFRKARIVHLSSWVVDLEVGTQTGSTAREDIATDLRETGVVTLGTYQELKLLVVVRMLVVKVCNE